MLLISGSGHALISLALAIAFTAQDEQPTGNSAEAPQAAESEETTQSEGGATGEPIEPDNTIVVIGDRTGGDPAMDAFLRGDFETAEVEFQRNFERLQRRERLKESSIEDAQSAQLSQPIAPVASGAAGGGLGAGGGSSGVVSSAPSNFNYTAPPNFVGARRSDGENVLYSGNDLGFQQYMKGLSQLQLGKLAEARVSFTRALRLNRTLYDSHFRLGLLDLNDGQVEDAKERLEKLLTGYTRCDERCPENSELEDAVVTLATLIKQAGS